MSSLFARLMLHRLTLVGGVLLLAPSTCPAQSITTLPAAPQPTEATLMRLSLPPAFFSTSQQQAPVLQPRPDPNEPSLADLGLDAKPDPDLQHRLDLRTHDLKVHQELGLVTLAPLAAACLTSGLAPPDPRKGNNDVGRDIHVALGSASVALYGFTAYYAIKAPRIPNEGPTRGGIKVHKYLIYIHAPGMLLTPILGAMAYNQAANGEKVHGVASAHAAVALITTAAYAGSIVAVSWPIHLGHFGVHHSTADTADAAAQP
jgi:hypothetical protein